jgi:tRNA threonylcarbamoyladenosine biosynthesis protein TsaE
MARRHYVLALPGEAATLALAGALARVVPGGSDVHLEGELAAGKTTFARGFLRALGHAGPVKSPTFTLVECYEFESGQAMGRPDLRAVHHFDLYRLGEPAELLALGFEDYHAPDAICLIEWPRRGGSLPAPAVRVELTATGLEKRLAVLELGTGVTEESAAEFEVLVANIK